ncbi:VWA domain-containing protein [Sulfurimonas sp. SAG-AH-194-C21]|nr:VWA domain-containing protein [Sulfurimonas sp. SAG-AH-194-C21]MDF1882733.1 VWA domain-containing protein [Sulfurimonas sp. SAG-AH-194-C21]
MASILAALEYEETIGKFWNKFLDKNTDKTFKEASVSFLDISKSLKLFYHLLGGKKGKDLHITDKRFVEKNRTLLEKISASGTLFFLPWQDEDALYLPSSLAYFETKELNILLYYWLIAMFTKVQNAQGSLEDVNTNAINELINIYPGFKTFYEQRDTNLDAHPSIFWIYPALNSSNKYSDFNDEDEPRRDEKPSEKTDTLKMKKKANQLDDKKETDGLLAFLPDAMMSIMEQVNVDRSEDDSFDEDALYNAEDLDEITLGAKKANLSARLKLDLDLSMHSKEEYPLGEGHFIDEWDYSKEKYLKNYVCIKPYLTTNIEAQELPLKLKKIVKKLEGELDMMELERIKNDKLPYGNELNLDTWIEYKGHQNKSMHHQKFYENYEKKLRDISTLILADVSLSTEAGITQEIRVIDVIKDSLIVFSESLERLQDNFSIYTFSSLKNKNVRIEIIKNFKEKYSAFTRGRISAIKPGYYTRLGAAIREASSILVKQKTQNRLLLIISDGKPNDVDRYDGRYGVEDTKKAIVEAKKLGLTPFCITIDIEAKEYLPYLFGKNGYALIRDSKKLPTLLPQIYLNLTK